VVLLLFCVSNCRKTTWKDLDNYTFKDYVVEYNKVYSSAGEAEFRQSIFEQKLRIIKEHNKDTSKTWKKGVNHLTDRTETEFKQLLGVKKSLIRHGSSAPRIKPSTFTSSPSVPSSRDWRQSNIISSVKDQGMCGSCWSFATAETVESYWAQKTGQLSVLSEQQILDCTPNPKHCGGTGGCGGATAELGFASIVSVGGLSSEWTYPYVSYQGNNEQCHFDGDTPPIAVITGYEKLPPNEYLPLLNHVGNIGPLAISVDASSWGEYESGVYDGCNQTNPDIDHAVQLVGYNTTAGGVDYWIVRNSWSPAWGENGYINLRRYSDKLRCGIDLHPQDGTGCDNGPKTVVVCGTCGILYDNFYLTL